MKVKNTMDRIVHFDFQIEKQLVDTQVFCVPFSSPNTSIASAKP